MDPVRDAARAVLESKERLAWTGSDFRFVAAAALDALQAAVDAADEAEGRMVLAEETGDDYWIIRPDEPADYAANYPAVVHRDTLAAVEAGLLTPEDVADEIDWRELG
jgi:hypothetical protein